MIVTVTNGELPEAEKLRYIEHTARTYDINHMRELTIRVDGDYVELTVSAFPHTHERIRRFSGIDPDYYEHTASGLLEG